MKLRVKKYKNRKLYDLEAGEYISLKHLKDAVVSNIPVEVIRFDGVDVTNDCLIEILRGCNIIREDITYLIQQGS